jgi:hypothetical protein
MSPERGKRALVLVRSLEQKQSDPVRPIEQRTV